MNIEEEFIMYLFLSPVEGENNLSLIELFTTFL